MQISCQLCQVPFKIGRFRTSSEPRRATLSSSRIFWPEEGSCRQYGCKTTIRRGNAATNSSELADETTTEICDDVLYSVTNTKGDGIASELLEPVRSINWQAHSDALGEHIAGPNCVDTQGYNGNSISVEEMMTCNTIQCLMEKVSQDRDWLPDWDGESDDDEVAKESDYFLSGIGDRIGSWEDDAACSPVRHDVDYLDPAFGNRCGFTNGDMALHPHCFEIYRRVFERRVGAASIDGLAKWWDERLEVFSTPMHAAVRCGKAQWWQHHAGDEFLAADPLQIPALTVLLEAASRPQDSFKARSSPFATHATMLSHHSDLLGGCRKNCAI